MTDDTATNDILRELVDIIAPELWDDSDPPTTTAHKLQAAAAKLVSDLEAYRMTEQKDHLICPNCGGDDIRVYRDGKATRSCRQCHNTWLPAQDSPEAGGPYARRDGPYHPDDEDTG